ncbi:TRAP transporter large permease subunit [Roseovarius pacificus]|uniref:TRAP transporter large permease n=1 Tax=Roseovarius pacificus TaxID=337701 RepID=UPI002A18C42E|nr:TRAP transporter large permease subunit [Roseovarius pacificus]
MTEMLPLLMFGCLFLLIFSGVQVAFALMVSGFVFGLIEFDFNLRPILFQFTQKIDETASNFVLAAVPLFVFMGAVLERSGIAQQLFKAVQLWTGRLPGGLAVGTILMSIIFAASTGVVGATEAVIGLLAIPPMMREGYDKSLISGTICAGGSLGTIIPPSVVVIILGPVANVSIGDLMVGMIVPGTILALLYLAYVVGVAIVMPHKAPRTDPAHLAAIPMSERLAITAKALFPPLLMIVAVLGTIIAGVAAPTEAAAIGALASVLLAAGYRTLSMNMLRDAAWRTLIVTAMIMFVLLGGSMFTVAFGSVGGITQLRSVLGEMDVSPTMMLAIFLGIIFIAGFFLEWISIILIFIPIFMPFVRDAGYDPVWFCMLILLMVQTSYLTPPLAPAIFYLRGIAPPEMTLVDMYKGVVPFIGLQAVCLAIIAGFPGLSTWLPSLLLGF